MNTRINSGGAPAASPAASPSGTAPGTESDFFTALGMCLGMPIADAAAFRSSMVFTGPVGLPCQVLWQAADADSQASARPEVFLPLEVNELAGPGMRHLFNVQAMLLSEFGWYLGVSGEGWLHVTPQQWMSQPEDVAAALDVGNLLAAVAMDRLAESAAVA